MSSSSDVTKGRNGASTMDCKGSAASVAVNVPVVLAEGCSTSILRNGTEMLYDSLLEYFSSFFRVPVDLGHRPSSPQYIDSSAAAEQATVLVLYYLYR